MTPYAIHWFRRDLRLKGNRGLAATAREYKGRVLGVFCVDPGILEREDLCPARFAFLLQTLRELRAEMREAGGDLLVVEGAPAHAFEKLFKGMRARPERVSWNRDYEPYALTRDAAMEELFSDRLGTSVATHRDHLLFEPNEIVKPDRKAPYYQVYGAYRKKWIATFLGDDARERFTAPRAPSLAIRWSTVLAHEPARDLLETTLEKALRKTKIPLPPAGAHAAQAQLKRFAREGLADYARARDIPAESGTSHLSVHLKNGAITVPEIIERLDLRAYARKEGSAQFKFLSELIWREFYYSILAHYPAVENEAFDERFRKLEWENSPELFDAWCAGRTGYPIVDAAMRQLSATGWMHNRARMIVASFLVKDLLIDWRWGERWFMRNLLDGDLASNNGGWQWAASTGTDPQPWFRVFNPELQSRKFDPRGEYIRKWVPELRELDDDAIHAPAGVRGYSTPIVEHAERKARAIALFKKASKP